MLKIKKNEISLTRGDSAYITFNITDGAGQVITIGENDLIRCQVRAKPNGGELLFEGTIEIDEDGIVWHILPENTRELDVGDYYWDAQLELENGDVFSFIPVSLFQVIDEVTEV